MPRPVTIEDLARFVGVADPRLSPDGSRVAFVATRTEEKNKRVGQIFEVEIATGKVRRLTSGAEGAGSPRYLPDGSLLFSSSREGDRSQLYRLPADGGEARRITDFPEGSLGEFRPSPDGARIAYTFRETHPDRTKAAAEKREKDGLSEPAWELDDLWYRLDGDGYFGPQRYRLYVLETPGDDGLAEPRLLSDKAPHGQYAFDWTPDSRGLVVARTLREDPFRETPNDGLFRLDLDGNETPIPGLPAGEKEAVRVSPDGVWIAYAGDVDEEDPWGTRNTRAYLVPIGGGEPKDLTGETDHDLGASTLSDTKEAAFGAVLEWDPDGTRLLAQIGTRGATAIAAIPTGGGLEFLTAKAGYVGFGDSDGKIAAVVHGDSTHLPEIAVADLATGEVRRLTRFNDDLDLAYVQPEEFETTAGDGYPVHGWALFPAGDGPFPGILEVHGGPHAQYGDVFFHEFQVLAAAGYAVVYTNPRGSKGYGEAHTASIRGAWGTTDWMDVEAATRWMEAHPKIADGRIGIMGGSYGGYMTNWAIGHSKAYRAAITDRCVSNMVSMAGNSDFPSNKDGYFKGTAYGDLEAIRELWRQSPISAFEGVTTPTLVIHSEGDLRCNIEQGEQVFSALKMQGVPSRFVRYPRSTWHGMSRSGPNDLRMHRLREIVAWMDRYLKS